MLLTPPPLRRFATASVLVASIGLAAGTPAGAHNNDKWFNCRDRIATAYWNHGYRYPEAQDQFEEDAVTLCGDLYRPIPWSHDD